ncbi:MAG: S-layer homology domain-containing protein [Lachnospirales bacterium]
MKKFLAILLSAVMTISAQAFVYAEDNLNIDCQISNSALEVGETFYADFKVTDNPMGYNNMTAYMKYDPSVIRAIECQVEDIPSDLIIVRNDSGIDLSLFSFIYTNDRVNFVPSKGDRDYDGYADGKKSAAEIGIIKLTNFLGYSIDNYLQNYEGTGTLVRMKFEAVGSGSTDITLNNIEAAYYEEGNAHLLNVSCSSGSVTVTGGQSSEPTTETTTTDAATETTTSSTSGSTSSGSSSGGGGGGSSSSSTATTTTEATTMVTTENTEVTTSAVADNTQSISFKDVSSDAWYYNPVITLANKGVINGYNDNTFKPNDNVKRADFLLMLLRGIGVDTTAVPSSNFADVSSSKYYYNAVGIAKEMGIASGDGTNFNPESNITRQDMMVLAKKALEIKTGNTITGSVDVLDKFNDKDTISAYAVDSLAAMVSEGIVNGMGDSISPKTNTTRAQAAVIISNIMAKL